MEAGFVSCDIVGHSGVKDLAVQRSRIEGINALVARFIEEAGPDLAIWASGGDGGHVALLHDDWPEMALALMTELRLWAEQDEVPLRITGHAGDIAKLTGADGRTQLVGDGINLAGRVLEAGVSGGIAVTPAFRSAVAERGLSGPVFHAERKMRPKYFPAQELSLVSIPGKFTSSWETLLRLEPVCRLDLDRALLEGAATERRVWDMLYHAKRIMQVHAQDKQAADTLDDLGSHEFAYKKRASGQDVDHEEWVSSSFLGCFNDPDLRLEVIRISQLVERRRGELLCDIGDSGDSMFVILRGRMGIFPDGVASEGEVTFMEPPFTVAAGETVGEIAFVLKRHRTAALMALEDTALLSLNLEHISGLARQFRDDIEPVLDRFLNSRILSFVCDRLPFLVGPDGTGPLREIKSLAERMLRYSTRIDCPWTDRTLAGAGECISAPGIYVLVRGKLRDEASGREWDSSEEPRLVLTQVGGAVSCKPEHLMVEEDITLMHIDIEAFLRREPVLFRRVTDAIGTLLTNQEVTVGVKGPDAAPEYDVFVSYRRETGSILARSIEQALKAKVRVFLDVETLGTGHFDTALLGTIASAPNFLVVLTKGSLDRCGEPGDWLRTEVAHAIERGRNIIVITTADFSFPDPQTLPKEIREIVRHDALRYDHVYFNAMIGKILNRIAS